MILRHVQPSWSATAAASPTDHVSALLDWADPDPDTRIVLIGTHTLETMCALIRRGSVEVATIRPAERPDANCADLAVITDLPALTDVEPTIAHARRALVPLGTVVLRLAAPATHLAVRVTDMLIRHGFARIRTRTLDGAVVIRAELPLQGPLPCA